MKYVKFKFRPSNERKNLERMPGMGAYAGEFTKLIMSCQREELKDILEEIFFSVDRIGPEISELNFRIEMAVREMLANAIEHGCESSQQHIEVTMLITLSCVKITVKDPGEGFCCKNIDLCDMPVMSEKGRGLAMINNAVDEIYYNDSGNEITVLIKG